MTIWLKFSKLISSQLAIWFSWSESIHNIFGEWVAFANLNRSPMESICKWIVSNLGSKSWDFLSNSLKLSTGDEYALIRRHYSSELDPSVFSLFLCCCSAISHQEFLLEKSIFCENFFTFFGTLSMKICPYVLAKWMHWNGRRCPRNEMQKWKSLAFTLNMTSPSWLLFVKTPFRRRIIANLMVVELFIIL